MSSLIEGYNYDIFISYCQKDNKHDGWVTEFVDNLKGELESTFKEEISVYFDINPHDGLLETHDVDESLKEKLKCLVFIPIISRTYCDQRSFAWEHEFIAFVEQASKDQFGLKVKLPNGNVAGRVLPVRIYDLDDNDVRLYESVLDTVLRGIEFIYREPGVNRPLKPDDDEKINLNRTKYRNQINKTANAVRDVITALEHYDHEPVTVAKDIFKPASIPSETGKTKIVTGSLILLALIVLGFFLLPKLLKSEGEPEKTIAVLLFQNYSGDPSQEYMCNGLTNEIIGHLYKIKSFDRVVPIDYVLPYRGTDKKPSRIADELKVNYILSGNFNTTRDTVRITAHLIDPRKDKILWQNGFDQPYKRIITIPADIATQIADCLKTNLTALEKQNIERIPTTNLEAYQLIQQTKNQFNTRTYESLNQLYDLSLKAIDLDPGYADAYAGAGSMLILTGTTFQHTAMQTVIEDALKLWRKALELDQNNASAHCGLALYNDWIIWDYIRAEEEFLKAIELSPNNQSFMKGYSEFLQKRNRLEDARAYKVKAEDDPIRIDILSLVLSGEKDEAHKYLNTYLQSKKIFAGEYFIWLEDYEAAKSICEAALQKKSQSMLAPRYQACLALAYYKTNDHHKAQMIIDQLIEKSDISLAGSPEFYTGWYYSGIGKIDSAFYWLEKAYKNRCPEIPWLKVDPGFKNIRSDDRYWDLYERAGHKAYDDYRAGLKRRKSNR
ncbi:MAG: hypothetical protein K0B37_02885 [Bacteroidales bacterium]|nr:hypothetical protein [Bacteroidales bacterium]